MAAVTYPRRVLSTSTTITVNPAGGQTPAWVQTIGLGEFATIPANPTIQTLSPTRSFTIERHTDSDNGFCWSDSYGPGGGMLFFGGGHTAHEFPYCWVFDGLQTENNLPGWRVVQSAPQPPCTVPGSPLLYNGVAPFRFDEGSEFSSVQANMPGDAILYGHYYKKQSSVVYGSPAGSLMYYGELATNAPAAWHTYNSTYPLAPGELGVGAKGGWACSQKHSVTSKSGIWVPIGHIMDGATGLWSRQQFEWPHTGPNGANTISNNGSYGKSCAFDGFAYTMLSENGVNALVRTDLTTGAHTAMRLSANMYPHYGRFTGVPGTTIIGTMRFVTMPGWSSGAKTESKLCIINVDPALPYTSRTPTFININPATPNPLADPAYLGRREPTFAHATALIEWIPEVGKFAAFGAQRPENVAQTHGDWPFGIVWYTPPNPPEEGTATWFTDLWTAELEPLTAVDARSQDPLNRGAGQIVDTNTGSTIDPQLQYGASWYSSKLRCFIHMPEIGQGNVFFFRSSKIP